MKQETSFTIVIVALVLFICFIMFFGVPNKPRHIQIDAPPPDPNQIIAHDGPINIYLYGDTKLYVQRKLE